MAVTTLGIDLAKHVFHLYGEDARGKAVLRKWLSRAALKPFLATLPPCRVGMEACGGAHYWAREFQQLGYEVHLINPKFVKPFVKSNKNDDRDAEAICEAVTRPNLRFVPVKTVAQAFLAIPADTRGAFQPRSHLRAENEPPFVFFRPQVGTIVVSPGFSLRSPEA
jgi:transposase